MNIPTRQLDPLSIGRKLLVKFVLAGSFLRDRARVRSELAVAGCGAAERAHGRRDQRGVVRSDCGADGDLRRGVCGAAGRGRVDERRCGDGREAARWELRFRRSICRRGRCCRRSCRAPEAAMNWTARASCLSGWWRAIRGMRRGGRGWGLRTCSMRGMGWAGRCMCWRRGGRLTGRWSAIRDSVEANLYRVYMLLSRGEKESARHGIEHLLQEAGNDWNVHLVAGITLRNRWAVRGGAGSVQHVAAVESVECGDDL